MTSNTSNKHSRQFRDSVPAPLPFAPTLGSITQHSASSPPTNPINRLKTPSAAPPPPLHLPQQYPGAGHTLGPTFSDEEDGDDSAFIASRMALLGLDPAGMPYAGDYVSPPSDLGGACDSRIQAQADSQLHWQYRQQRLAHHYNQRQTFLQNLMMGQRGGMGPPGHQQVNDILALLEIQSIQQAFIDPHYQAQLSFQAQAKHALLASQMQQGYSDSQSSRSASAHRSAVAAQMQANLRARTTRDRPMNPDDIDLRAIFENAPTAFDAHHPPANASTLGLEQALSHQSSSPSHQPWRANLPPSNASHRAAPSQAFNTSHVSWRTASSSSNPQYNGTLQPPSVDGSGHSRYSTSSSVTISPTSFSSRQKLKDEFCSDSESSMSDAVDTAETSSMSASSEPDKAFAIQALGRGRPKVANTPGRAWSAPVATRKSAERGVRAASYGGPVQAFAIRQPIGPPSGTKEVIEINFQTRIRRQVGLRLGMLNRRTDLLASTSILK